MSAAELDPFVAANELNLWILTRRAATLLVRTIGSGPAPHLWSDSELAQQRLELVVEEALCGGDDVGRDLVLDISVVRGARSAAATPELAHWLAVPGARWILFLEPDIPPDEDLGMVPATDSTVAWVRVACTGPPPPGLGTVLYLLAAAAERDADVRAAFAAMPTAVVDVLDPLVRVTVSAGRVRVFTGLRAVRVSRMREPDARIRASARQLAELVLDQTMPDAEVEGDDRGLLDALGRAGLELTAETRQAIRRSVRVEG